MNFRETLFWPVFFLNIAGFLYGITLFYPLQLLSASPFLWIFIPDCPLFALTFALSLLFLRLGKRWNFFYFLSFAGGLKYGFWTVFVLAFYSSFYFSPQTALMYGALFVAHIFLFLEQFALPGKVRVKAWFLPAALLFFFLFDVPDYLFFFTHPPLPLEGIEFMFYATLAMTAFFSFFSFFALKKFFRPILNIFP